MTHAKSCEDFTATFAPAARLHDAAVEGPIRKELMRPRVFPGCLEAPCDVDARCWEFMTWRGVSRVAW